MVYIPTQWIKNPQNKQSVFDLMTLEHTTEEIKQGLSDLGESVVLEHFENGDIVLDL